MIAWCLLPCADRELSLPGAGVGGVIPPSLGQLSQLSTLDLSGNALEGTIPSSLASLTALVFLNLSSNNLTGDIPSWAESLGLRQRFVKSVVVFPLLC